MSEVSIHVPLCKLVGNRRNPRRVKPERDAHRQLVASIRTHGLLEPLVVRPAEGQAKHYQVIAGNRRLAALREIHRDQTNAKVPCCVREADDQTASAMSLSENFVREPMHPLDEAEAFAKLARIDAKGVSTIAAEFGVTEGYVRQRMKLAALSDVIKAAYRADQIDTATAEAFAPLPEARQLEVWAEVNGNPQHARHVHNVIDNGWIDAKHALFDVTDLPDNVISRDLFNDRVMIERTAFYTAQADALIAEQTALTEAGWNEVVLAPVADVQDRLWSMTDAPGEYDDATKRKLDEIQQRRDALESTFADLDEGDEEQADEISRKLEELDAEDRAATDAGELSYGEAVKAHGTAFLVIGHDGQVRREFRVPRKRFEATQSNGATTHDGGAATPLVPAAPTSDDVNERQTATTFTHEALAVRQALLGNLTTLKRVAVLALHPKVRREALAIRCEANATTLHADNSEGFRSVALDTMRAQRAKIDPMFDGYSYDEAEAYEKLRGLDEPTLDALTVLLMVEFVTAHQSRVTPLVRTLATELGVNVRAHWRPDAPWLNAYKKCQLAHLIGELRGPVFDRKTAEGRKKSELVEMLDRLFADAAEGRVDDPRLAERVNAWLPSNLRADPAT